MQRIINGLLAGIGLILLQAVPAAAQDSDKHPLAGMPLRNIGPALVGGRVSDFAFYPDQPQVFFVALASGGLWKTENNGITWKPLFDNEGSFALGVVEIDPQNDNIIWVGSGENNSQRSVGYGDGVYKSVDGGKSWSNVGLQDSGHISMIRFHPEDSNTVFVAAQGPLWNSGGDRGLYKTTDGGETWERILDIDEHTGINEFVIDADNPDVIVASSYQRQRRVWTLINGGPGAGIHKTTDGGQTWRKLSGGLPGGDLGRIGLTAAPSEPDMLYAIIEADESSRGVYRSTDFGESWEKRSNRRTSSGQYYNELFVDPLNADRVYSVDTFTAKSEDGGKSWENLSFVNRHVDDHAIWIDPRNTAHVYIGGDGGIYETWDRGQTWQHMRNLPVAQFYRATPDNDVPFYNVCAGTQDNHTLCGPSRTRFTDGITNADWWVAQFGDGFKAQFDPENPDIVYAQYQHGGLVRMDKTTGERVSIGPRPPSGENNYKWNWNSPLIVSPHNPARLYFGAERLFRSDDRGNSWQVISPDLTRQLDRNELEIMGRIWSVDAIAKNASTSIYGALIAVAESPLQEGLIYAGTDDGLIQVTEDGGENWRRVDSFSGVPDQSLVEDIIASEHDADVAFAVLDNHKRGDFKPYVFKTSDRGRSWRLMSNNLPERGTAHTLAQDHVDPNLLFVGTEFGLYFSNNGGSDWHELTSLPTIAVRDLEIQRREGDLVVGTFGRGVYILDDYSALRLSAEQLANGATLLPIRDTWLFTPDDRRGWGGRGDYGNGKYAADNPAHGATISYYLSEGLQTKAQQRRKTEKEAAKEGGDNPYPSWEALRAEDREEDPNIIVTIRDAAGDVVRRMTGPVGKGLHRLSWDLRYPTTDPVDLSGGGNRPPWFPPPSGPVALPGEYTVSIAQRVDGQLTELTSSQSFTLKPLFNGGLVSNDRRSVLTFQQEVAELNRQVSAANQIAGEISNRIAHVKQAIAQTPAATEQQAQAVRSIEARLADLQIKLNGDATIARRYEPVPLPISARLGDIMFGQWESQADITQTHRDSLLIATSEFAEVDDTLTRIEADLQQLQQTLESIGAPWTPGRR